MTTTFQAGDAGTPASGGDMPVSGNAPAQTQPTQEVDRDRDALRDHAEHFSDLGLAADAAALAAIPDFPAAPSSMPLVVDTDLGGDPDDAVALAVAAGLPELALVVTSDEHDRRRARLARHLLDLLGRADVPVIAGRDLGNTRYWAADGLTPDTIPDQSTDLVAAVEHVVARAERLRWLAIGPLSNLADLASARPDLANRLAVTAMGGAINYRHPDRAEHNIRLDVDAARTVLATSDTPWIVPSDVSFTSANEITVDSPEYEALSTANNPTWERLLTAHMDQWFAGFHPGTMQHDALALALSMRLPFLDVSLTTVVLDDIGRMSTNSAGRHVFLTTAADYPAFRRWLTQRLTKASNHAMQAS